MKTTAVLKPAPPVKPPQGTVTLTMSENDARVLLQLTCWVGGDGRNTARASIGRILGALRAAGVKESGDTRENFAPIYFDSDKLAVSDGTTSY